MMMMMMMMKIIIIITIIIIIIIIIIIGWYKRSQATYASYVLGYEPGAHEHKKVLFFFFFFFFFQEGALTNPSIKLVPCAVQIFLSLPTVTVKASFTSLFVVCQ